MDKLKKALMKLSAHEKTKIKLILQQIQNRNPNNLDIKKLKGRKDIYRVRKGKMRIIFRYVDNSIYILGIERRSDTTYK